MLEKTAHLQVYFFFIIKMLLQEIRSYLYCQQQYDVLLPVVFYK